MITKHELIEYFRKPNFDVVLSQLIEDFKINKNEVELLKKLLKELIKELYINKTYCEEHKDYEYDPGEKLNYGGLEYIK